MGRRKIALGTALPSHMAVVTGPRTLEEKVASLQRQIEELTRAFNMSHRKDRREVDMKRNTDANTNKDGLTIGSTLFGMSTRGGIHSLTVNKDGYYLGRMKYDSLSAAAEASSGIRRSGWSFWKLPDGRTVKEAYGKY